MTLPLPTPAIPVVVKAEPASRLDELDTLYADAKREADAAAERLKTITDAIKYELANAAPGAARVDFQGTNWLRLQAKTQWRLDTKKLKEQEPETYVRYAVQSTCWELRTLGRSS